MKKLIFLSAFVCSLLSVQIAVAQNPITTLQHKGATTVFYGQGSLVDAYNTSVNGDTLCLSTGYFTAPTAIAKGIKIIGAGHFPDSASVAKRTYILSGLTINAGADSLRLEGLYIDGDIYYAASPINYVKVVRCRLGSARFNSNSSTVSKNYCSYDECFITGIIDFSYYGTTLSVFHSIIGNAINNISGSALIEGNIFLNNNCPLYNVASSLIVNNIFLENYYNNIQSYCTGNTFNNNVIVESNPSWGTNTYINNYTGVAQATIFVNQTGNNIDYTHDYHLKTPATYIGTDGTQVGLYGTGLPFKDKGVASNPSIVSKSVSPQTDANGNLQINFTVKAQDR